MLTSFQSAPEPKTCLRRLLRVVEFSFYALALAPAAFVAWQAVLLLRNIPMWDEFETVLKFLMRYESMASLRDAIGPLVALANEHCMVTSRLIVLLLFELTGEANFIHLAVVGNLAVVGVVMLLVCRETNRLLRLLLGSLTSLLIFQLQHHENFFSSYASIDHFLVVFLTTGTLVMVVRGGTGALWGAGWLAALAAFTLAHGIAVLAVAATILWFQRRSGHLVGWSVGGLLIAALFGWRLSGATLSLAPPFTPHGLMEVAAYWVTLLGGVPALGGTTLATLFGVLLVALLVWLTARKAYHTDPLLWGVAVNAALAALLIAYGRAHATDVSPLSSRYMVQSAMAWSAVLVMLLKQLDSPWRILAWGLMLVAAVGSANVTASARYLPSAREFVQRRIDAARYYDLAQSLVGVRRPIYPQAREADAILEAAAKSGLYRLAPRKSLPAELDVPLVEQALLYHVDRLVVGRRNLHVRGWMVTSGKIASDLRPHLVLKRDGEQHVFRGRRETRTDVAAALGRPDADRSGFYFVIPLDRLPPSADLAISLVLKGGKRALFSNTDHKVRTPQSSHGSAPLSD